MKGTSSKDLLLIFVLAIITAIFTSINPLNNFIMNIFIFILIFISSGYSLMAVLYPEENYSGLIRKPLLLIELCVFLTVLISVILKYSAIGLQFRDLTLILSLTTLVLSITAHILRINYFKPGIEKTIKPDIGKTSTSLKKVKALQGNIATFILLSILMIITVLVPPLNKTSLWMIPGSLFVCFIPGYLLMAVMFPKTDDLELVERFALGFGASLILTSLIGLAFNYTPWHIRLELILIVLAVFSLIFCLITFIRSKKLPQDIILHIPKLEKLLSIFLILCIILTIGTAAYTLLNPGPTQTDANDTDFHIKGMDVNASNYTLNLTSGTKKNLTMVLVNREGSTVNYRLVVQVNNTILKQENITLQNNQEMEIPLNFTAGTVGQKKMEFILYKLPDQNPYQKRSLWLKIT